MIPVRIALVVQPVPQRERHSEVALSADAPIELKVLRPVAVPQPHKIRMPLYSVAHLDQPVFFIHQPDKPLSSRNEFERPVAFLIELYRVLNWLWRVDQRRPAFVRGAMSISQKFGNRLLGCLDCFPGKLLIKPVRGPGVARFPTLAPELYREQTAIPPQDLPERQFLLTPPFHVSGIAESANHQDSGALFRLHHVARKDRDRNTEQRRNRVLAEKAAIPGIVGMGRHADAGWKQLGPGRCYYEGIATLDAESQIVKCTGQRAVFDLSLSDGRLKIHVPHSRGIEVVDVALLVEVYEASLSDRAAHFINRRVLLAPVDR